jgi:hypothetical protein
MNIKVELLGIDTLSDNYDIYWIVFLEVLIYLFLVLSKISLTSISLHFFTSGISWLFTYLVNFTSLTNA